MAKRYCLTSSDYALHLEDDRILDIPEEMRSLSNYRATLGHKVCHSFQPNAFYGFGFHPVFGKIRTVVALKDIGAGEEITCDYRYKWSKSPQWYKDALVQYCREKGHNIDEWLKKQSLFG